jgi:hypothetical protein
MPCTSLLKEFEELHCLQLVHPWRLLVNRAEEREEEEERKKKALLEGMVSAHVSHNRVGPIVQGAMRKSQVHLSYSFSDLNSVFYLCKLGSLNRHAPLTHKPDNGAPLVSPLCLGLQR